MEVDGSETIVRESDGIHLNEAGSALAAEIVLDAIDDDFDRQAPSSSGCRCS